MILADEHALAFRASLRARLQAALAGFPLSRRSELEALASIGGEDASLGRLAEGHINALQLVRTFGSSEQRTCLASNVEDGALFGVWNTEDADALRVVDERGDSFVIAGRKSFCSGAHILDYALVTVRHAGGAQLCLIDLADAALSIDAGSWRPLGMLDSDSFTVAWHDAVLQRERVVGSRDDYYRQPWFGGGAVRFCAVQWGVARAIFTDLVRYLRTRERDADPHQLARIGRARIAIQTGRLWLDGAAARWTAYDDTPTDANAETVVAIAREMRFAIEAVAREVMMLCETSVGARGLLEPHPFARRIADLTMYLRQPNPDGALVDVGRAAVLWARSHLSTPGAQLGERDF